MFVQPGNRSRLLIWWWIYNKKLISKRSGPDWSWFFAEADCYSVRQHSSKPVLAAVHFRISFVAFINPEDRLFSSPREVQQLIISVIWRSFVKRLLSVNTSKYRLLQLPPKNIWNPVPFPYRNLFAVKSQRLKAKLVSQFICHCLILKIFKFKFCLCHRNLLVNSKKIGEINIENVSLLK